MSATVNTVVGTGRAGSTDTEVNDPYGVVVGPDGALYFCEVGNQMLRRFDLQSGAMTVIAGNGQRGPSGDGGPATDAALNMPHELCFGADDSIYIVERDSHAVRKIDRATGIISTVAGTGAPGFSGDGGLATQAQLNQPHSIAFDSQGALLICDIGNHRVRRLNVTTGVIDTYAGTGERAPTPDGAPLAGTPLNGPRTIVVGPDGALYLALREGNAIYRIDTKNDRIEHLAGTGDKGHTGDGGLARAATLAGPKGLAYGHNGTLYIADTENHAIRAVNLATGIISTVLGTGERGDGPEPYPLACRLARPHGLWSDSQRGLFVADSEAHRIRLLT
jgi:DNA-binding beta-propeller fold protein YncE